VRGAGVCWSFGSAACKRDERAGVGGGGAVALLEGSRLNVVAVGDGSGAQVLCLLAGCGRCVVAVCGGVGGGGAVSWWLRWLRRWVSVCVTLAVRWREWAVVRSDFNRAS
jgi:hypothetical protein